MSKSYRVSSNSDIDDDTIMYPDPKPLKMIIPVYISTKESKNDVTKRKTTFEKVSASIVEPSLKNLVETVISSSLYLSRNQVNLEKQLVRNKISAYMLNHLMIKLLNQMM